VLTTTSVLPAVDEASRLASRPSAWQTVGSSRLRCNPDRLSAAHVEISPPEVAERQSLTGRGIRAELIQLADRNRIEFRYRGPTHLILAYQQGARGTGETFIDGASRSTPRDFARKLTLLPAGHDYFEWHQLQTSMRLLTVHFDASELDAGCAPSGAGSPLKPLLFFEDGSLWSTIDKLTGLLANAGRDSLPYFDALGAVLMHEVLRVNGDNGHGAPTRGGLAAWQRRLVASHIEDHLAEQISLTALARLVRLSPYHFSRAFKQSFGMPPHRYHTYRRIERAKVLLGGCALSVTDIGLSLGFNEASSFTTTFRKMTGLTPSRYHRSIPHLPLQT
jgi:AraC family transcriptional regulator